MKKLIIFFIALVIISFSCTTANALTEQERQSLINQIRGQILQLQTQLWAQLQREKAGSGTVKIYGPDKKSGKISVNYGDYANISWQANNVDYCSASGNWQGFKNISGTESTGFLISSGIYNISCKDYSGKVVMDTLTINVVLPEVDIKANGSEKAITIVSGKAVTLGWTAKGVKSCFAFGDWQGDKNLTGSESAGYLNYARRYVYGISCNSNKGIISDTIEVNVSIPTVNIKANSADGSLEIISGKSVKLSWATSGILSCTALGNWAGSKKVSGSESVGSISSTKFYVLECIDFLGNKFSDTVSVIVK